MSDQTSTVPAPAPKRRSKTPLVLAGLLAVGLAGVATTSAFSQAGYGPMAWRHGQDGHFRGAGPRGGNVDPARMNAMIERGIKHLAIDIDATPDQTSKLITIAEGAAKDLMPLRQQMREARQKGHDLLVAPTLDRATIETFRAQQVALFDQTSKRIAQAIGDVNEVLTPAQRIKVAGRLPGLGMGGFGGPERGGEMHRGGPDGHRPGMQRRGDIQNPNGAATPDHS